MGTLTAVVHDDFIKMLDKKIKESRRYSSRSEFLKDAIREKYEKLLLEDPLFRKIHEESMHLRELARARGWNGKLPTRKERAKIAREYLKENGITVE